MGSDPSASLPVRSHRGRAVVAGISFSLVLHGLVAAAFLLCLGAQAEVTEAQLPVLELQGDVSGGGSQAGGEGMVAGQAFSGRAAIEPTFPPGAATGQAALSVPDMAPRALDAPTSVPAKQSHPPAPTGPKRGAGRQPAAVSPAAGQASRAVKAEDKPPGQPVPQAQPAVADGAGSGDGPPVGQPSQAAGGRSPAGGAGPAIGQSEAAGRGPGQGDGQGGALESAFGSGDGPRFAKLVPPRYPRQVGGTATERLVLLRLHIDAAGQLQQAAVVRSGGRDFDAAALAAVKESTFLPARQQGQPVASRAMLPIRFKLFQ